MDLTVVENGATVSVNDRARPPEAGNFRSASNRHRIEPGGAATAFYPPSSHLARSPLQFSLAVILCNLAMELNEMIGDNNDGA
jgi:hypothetical protein